MHITKGKEPTKRLSIVQFQLYDILENGNSQKICDCQQLGQEENE